MTQTAVSRFTQAVALGAHSGYPIVSYSPCQPDRGVLRHTREVLPLPAAANPALGDAARYRSSGTAATGCWDCENIPTGRCADHAKDNDRARAYAELAAALSADAGRDGLREPRDLSGYRRRRPVAS